MIHEFKNKTCDVANIIKMKNSIFKKYTMGLVNVNFIN